MTSYGEIYERFAQKITDYKLLELSDNDVREMMHSWMVSAISKFKRCKTDLTNRNDELYRFNEDLLDIEKEILAELMVGEWLAPQLNSVLYTSQFFGGKEEKFYSQANGLNSLKDLKETNRVNCLALMRDYGYQNFIWGRKNE